MQSKRVFSALIRELSVLCIHYFSKIRWLCTTVYLLPKYRKDFLPMTDVSGIDTLALSENGMVLQVIPFTFGV